MMLDVDRDSLL